jgi:hypothetical protein
MIVEAHVSDPCDTIRRVVFYAHYDDHWHQIGVDTDATTGWSVYWDAGQMPDQRIMMKAFASDMAGNGVETPINENILLDREEPSVNSLSFTPPVAHIGQPVAIDIDAFDNLAGVEGIHVYVDPSIDGSVPWDSWDLVGSMVGASGTVTWDTTDYVPGPHQVVLLLEDLAGNLAFWPSPGDPPTRYSLGYQIYLPLVTRDI